MYGWDGIVSIGASTRDGKMSDFSNYGSRSVDLFAPGTNIRDISRGNSEYAAPINGLCPDCDTMGASVNGTSFSSPISCGVAAYIWSQYPHLDPLELKRILMETVTVVPHITYDKHNFVLDVALTGRAVKGGILNFRRALYAASRAANN
eukprot:Gregarina_sp_Poly_1__3025@NODE_184_length_11778_cov_104_566988_g164_i0_p7_GENE_NODE_184_length_11778_cov_104_566988_g164_i0NODE_184_length_11778_cov_104_566988_g164_i0_p7_ORF_typecomplete_len149_score8_32Peptidase_S8/PF00082_22/1_2e22_NODE_184_length_11778_cov_104_566988_g164_i088539299